MQKIGVFVCHCGTNIAATVDVAKVAEMLGREPGVVFATDYPYMCSQTGQQMQRRNRKPREAEFRVVVVLDQKPLLAALHPRQQLLPPGNRHDGSGRILVRRGYMDNLRAACLQLCHADAAFVHRYRHDLRADSAVDLRQRPVAGVLDREALPAPKKLRQKRVKILCARADENLLRLDHKPALARQLPGNCLAQRKKPAVRHRL